MNLDLATRDLNTIWHPYTQMKLAQDMIPIVRGKGAYLYDEQGNQYLDAIASWWVNLHGHCHPHITKLITEQCETLEHVIFAGFTHPSAVELAERFLGHLPHQSKVFFSDNGSTAVEVALKMALQYRFNQDNSRHKVIAFRGAYHGDTFGAMSVSQRSAFTAPFESKLFDVLFIDPPTPGNEVESLRQLETCLAEHGSDIVAFIFEPLVQGVAGMVMYTAEALDSLLYCCKNNHIITIADEVMTGFGRTGEWFASDHLENKPDIMCFSKGLTGGTMAFAATTCTHRIYRGFWSDDRQKTFFHGHSFTANPLACAASLASLDLMEKKETWHAIESISEQHKEMLPQFQQLEGVKNVRQQGVILAIELQTDTGTSYFNQIRDQLYRYFMDQGILLRPLGNILYILPPYCIEAEDLKRTYDAIYRLITSAS